MAKEDWPWFNGIMSDAIKVVPIKPCHNDRMDTPPELQAVIDQHATLKKLEEQTRLARMRLGELLSAARAAEVKQKDISERTGENRETLRRWEREYDRQQDQTAS